MRGGHAISIVGENWPGGASLSVAMKGRRTGGNNG